MDLPDPPRGFEVVAFDFDGTTAEGTWPSPRLGMPIQGAIEAMLHYFGLGLEVIIYTARPTSHFPRMWRWLDEQGLSGVVYDITREKRQDVGLLFDDRAVHPPWLEVPA